ncbi:MAG: PEGA domain-containing protein [Methanococcaceae archaeon]
MLIFLVSGIIAFASCEKTVTTEPPDKTLGSAAMFFESEPSGAKIFLNGKNTGKITPDSIKWLHTGDYKIILSLYGYFDTSFIAKMTDAGKSRFKIKFTPNDIILSRIYCETMPTRAAIYLNGAFTGKFTPDTLKRLQPGKYKVKYSKIGYWDDSLEILTESGKVTQAYSALIDTSVWLNFNSVNSPLPSNFLNSVAIDNNGTKWIATENGGLTLYDGKTWTIYNTSNSPLPENSIVKIAFENNKAWIATKTRGIVSFDGQIWHRYNTSNSGLKNDNITTIACDYSGNKWIGTSAGLYKFDGTQWTYFGTENSEIPGDYINSIFIDQYQNKWISTTQGLATFNNVWRVYSFPKNVIKSKNVAGVCVVDGTLWAGVHSNGSLTGGLLTLDMNEPGAEFKIFDILLNLEINNIYMDIYSQVWIATNNIGFVKIQGTKFSLYNASVPAMTTNMIKDIIVDRNNVKWVSTYGGGLVIYKAKY